MITIKPIFNCVELKHGTEVPFTRRWEFERGVALIMANSNVACIYAASRGEFNKILNRILIATDIYRGDEK